MLTSHSSFFIPSSLLHDVVFLHAVLDIRVPFLIAVRPWDMAVFIHAVVFNAILAKQRAAESPGLSEKERREKFQAEVTGGDKLMVDGFPFETVLPTRTFMPLKCRETHRKNKHRGNR